MIHTAIVAVESLVAFFFLSLGLYITTRDLPPREEWFAWWKRPGLWGGLAMILASWFFVSVAVQTTIPDEEQYIFWNKWAWWTIPVAAASWYWAVWLFLVDEEQWSRASTFSQATPLFVLMASALLLSVAGVYTEFLFDYSATEPGQWSFETYYIPPSRPGHYLYVAYLSGGLSLCSLLLYHKSRDSNKSIVRIQALKWLYLGTGLVALGATVATVLYAELRIVPEQLGDTICAGGLFLVGVGVVKHNALVKGQVAEEDVKRMGLAVLVVVVIYWAFAVIMFHVLGHVSPPAVLYLPPLIYLAIFTHAVAGTVGLLVDRLTLPAWKAEYRFKLAQTMRTIITASNPIEKLALDEEVLARTARNARADAELQSENSIIEAIQGLLQQKPIVDIEQRDLLRAKLDDLHIVQRWVQTYTDNLPIGESKTETRALAIRDFLKNFIREDFRPPGEEPDPLSSEWIDFRLLYLRYVRGLGLEDVKDWMTPRIRSKEVPGAGRTWRQWYRNAKTRLAKRIYEAEKNYLLDQQ